MAARDVDMKAARDNSIHLVFVSNVVPDKGENRTAALSRAGNSYAQNMVDSLASCGLGSLKVLSFRPLRSFPHERPFWVRRGTQYLDSGVRIEGLPFLNFRVLKQITAGISAFAAILRWGRHLKNTDLKVVATYNLTFPPVCFVLAAARLLHAKVVGIVLDLDIPGEDRKPDTFLRRIEFLLQQWSIRQLDGLQACTDDLPRIYARGIPYVRVEGGVGPQYIEKLSDRKKRDPKVFTIFYAGRLSQLHGTDLLLEAFKKLQDRHYRLIVAGNGPLSDRVMKESLNDDRVRFLGYVPMEDLLPYMRSADLFVSLWRTNVPGAINFYPSKIIDCLATGTPLITTCCAHTEEEFGSFSFLLKEETPEALASLIEEIEQSEHKSLDEIGQKAREYVIRNKTWPVQIGKLKTLMRTLVETQ